MWHLEYVNSSDKRVYVLVGVVTLVEAITLVRISDPEFRTLLASHRESGTVWFLRQEDMSAPKIAFRKVQGQG